MPKLRVSARGITAGCLVSIGERRQGAELEPAELVEMLERVLDGRGRPAEADRARLEVPYEGTLSAELLVAGAKVLRERAVTVHAPPNRSLIDLTVAGAPDDTRLDVNVGAGILAAACDGTVAQHGWIPSRSGGGALVAALGLAAPESHSAARKALEQCGYAWLPKERFHPALSRAGSVAPDSLLALLGPLVNPAGPRCHLVGVRDPALTEPMARAFGLLGAEGALVVTSGGRPAFGLDVDTVGHRWSEGRVSTFHHPGTGKPVDGLDSAGVTVDAGRLEATFDGLRGPLAEAIALHAGAALWVAGLLPTFAEARRWARSRLAQRVDLTDFCGPTPVISPKSTPTDLASGATSRRSPHPPRGGARRSPGRKG